MDELLCADDLVLMSKTMEDLKEGFWNWGCAGDGRFEGKHQENEGDGGWVGGRVIQEQD